MYDDDIDDDDSGNKHEGDDKDVEIHTDASGRRYSFDRRSGKSTWLSDAESRELEGLLTQAVLLTGSEADGAEEDFGYVTEEHSRARSFAVAAAAAAAAAKPVKKTKKTKKPNGRAQANKVQRMQTHFSGYA